jgi:hypothetical protein
MATVITASSRFLVALEGARLSRQGREGAGMRKDSIRNATLALALFASAHSADAHGIAGNRFFVGTYDGRAFGPSSNHYSSADEADPHRHST